MKASANAQSVFVGGEFLNIAGAAHAAGSPSWTSPRARTSRLRRVRQLVRQGHGRANRRQHRLRRRQLRLLQRRDHPSSPGDQRHHGATLAGFDMPLTEPTNEGSEGGLRAMALSPDETRLMVIGNFRRIAAQDRPLVAQIDVSGPVASVTDWRTDVYDQPCARSGKVGFMRDVDIDPTAGRRTSSARVHFYYPACDTLNAFPMDPGRHQPAADLVGQDRRHDGGGRGRQGRDLPGRALPLPRDRDPHRPRFQIAAVDPDTGEGSTGSRTPVGSAACWPWSSSPPGCSPAATVTPSAGSTTAGTPSGRPPPGHRGAQVAHPPVGAGTVRLGGPPGPGCRTPSPTGR